MTEQGEEDGGARGDNNTKASVVWSEVSLRGRTKEKEEGTTKHLGNAHREATGDSGKDR